MWNKYTIKYRNRRDCFNIVMFCILSIQLVDYAYECFIRVYKFVSINFNAATNLEILYSKIKKSYLACIHKALCLYKYQMTIFVLYIFSTEITSLFSFKLNNL